MKYTVLITGLFLTLFVSERPGNGTAVTGKMYFSNKPFGETNAGAKTSFASNEFIYGRLEVQGGTLKDVFKLKESSEGHRYPFIAIDYAIYRNGQKSGNGRTNNYILLRADDLGKSYINFDVMPDPANVNTLYSMLEDFSAGNGFFPMYQLINQENFPQPGKYSVLIRFFNRSHNAWGKEEDMEKWPELSDEFEFNFSESDIATLLKNERIAIDRAVESAFRYDKLPAVFSSPATISDPMANNAKVAAIIKRDLPGRQILKMAIEKYNGSLWSIAHDDFGIPKYRYFNPHVWVAYKAGGKCYVGYVTLRQVYSGGGTYAPLGVAWTSTKDDKGIDCIKIK